MKQQINKKNKKSNQPVDFDIDMLKDELVKPKQQLIKKDSVSDKSKSKSHKRKR